MAQMGLSKQIQHIRLWNAATYAPIQCRYFTHNPAIVRETRDGSDLVANPSKPTQVVQRSGLERMSTGSLLRNLFFTAFLSTPILSRPGFAILDRLVNSQSRLTNVDSNPLLRAIIKPLVYDQFCAGINKSEISRTRDRIKRMGYSGIILCYGKEIQIRGKQLRSTGKGNTDQSVEINMWRDGNLETLDMVGKGDWLGMKLTGAGPGVTKALIADAELPREFVDGMKAICEKAAARGCRLWIDAEQQILQKAIDRFTIDLMRKYNRDGKVLVYNTLQAYLKQSRPKLQHQLALAEKEGWNLAIKLVRGAYIANDRRELIHDTKDDTDKSYDGIAHDLLSGKIPDICDETFSRVHLFLAGHNGQSVSKAWDLVQRLSEQQKLKIMPEFGQLQGMADELGCKILRQCDDLRQGSERLANTKKAAAVPGVYKCLTWGSIEECMQYLLRRVVENKGATDRMRDGMEAYYTELKRRVLLRGSV